MRQGERVPSCHERHSTLFAFFASAVTFSFARQLQWTHRLRSPFTGREEEKKSCLSWLSDTVCVTEHERTSGPCITKQSGGRLGCSEREAEVVRLPDTAGKEKTTLPNKAGKHSSLFPLCTLLTPSTFHQQRERGVIAGHTMNGLCKIWVSWWSMWPYSPRRQRGVGVKCVCLGWR